MKVVIAGGSGQLGTILSRAFALRRDEVVVLSRRPAFDMPWRVIEWDGETLGDWTREIDGADVVINLAGRSVNCRYGPENRRAILESRVRSTRVVGEAIARSRRPPRVWLQAATATIYAHRYDAANDERTGVIGGAEPHAPSTWRFSIDVARAWEATFDAAAVAATRKVLLRSAMVMSPLRGGTFDTLLRLVRWGLGGPAGDGRQFVSWVHDEDFTRALLWLIERDDIAGIVNVAAPAPLPYGEFVAALRRAAGIPFGLPSNALMLEIGAFLMRTETELVLKSRRVVPGRLLEAGFTFAFPTWPEAARDLCARYRASEERAAA